MKSRLTLLSPALIIIGLLVFAAVAGAERGLYLPSGVDPDILAQMARSDDGQARFIVYLRSQADLSSAYLLDDRVQKGRFVYETLRRAAQTAQSPILSYLRVQQATGHVTAYRSFWIFNGLAVTGDRETLDYLASLPEVERIVADRYRRLLDTETPTPVESTAVVTVSPTDIPVATVTPPAAPGDDIEWNIARLGADEVWDELGIDGTGVTVANTDTGVLYTHPALVNQYRGRTASGFDHNYNWYDATGRYLYAPADDNGHGTHTMGTIVGDDGADNHIGVAPGARWMAVKVLDSGGYGYDSDIHAGFQWLLAPTDLQGHNPDPAKAPQVVNNSWGTPDGWDMTFRADVQALLAAGIIPIFSAGNSGPFTGSIGAPASYPESWAVGATNFADVIATFSSRGPSPLTEAVKPEFCAPGADIRSSWNDGGYRHLDGTSMAAPHVAGLVALILQASSGLSPEEVQAAIAFSALDLGDTGPDYTYGWGRVDAYAAVLPISTAGTLTGRVLDGDTGASVAGASVVAYPQENGRVMETTTDAQGVYTFTLAAGRYDVSVHLYGYFPLTVTAVVSTDETTVQDIILPVLPRYTLSGYVTGAATGDPLAATVLILDTPLEPVQADPATGFYSVTVAQGTYRVKVKNRGYETVVRAVTIESDTTADFVLAPLPSVLLVDDDGGAEYETYFTDTLNALGEDYDFWEVAALGVPTLDTLEQYRVVIWTTGATLEGGSLSLGDDYLTAYLDDGGMLFLSSISYLSSSTKDARLVSDYLHVSYGWSATMPDEISGEPDDPVGAWLGPYIIASPFESYIPVISTDGESSIAFTISGYGYNAPVASTYFDRHRLFRTVYFAFPFEGLQGPDATVVMRRVLAWLRSDCSVGTLRGVVTDSLNGDPIAQATVTARSSRDRLSVETGSDGVYTLPLLADVYSLRVERDGYAEAELSALTVAADTTLTGNIALRPLIVVTPPVMTVELMAGRVATRTLFVSNTMPDVLDYAFCESVPGDVPPNGEPSTEFDIPFAAAIPIIDGVYSADEWRNAAVVHLTPYDDPTADPIGAVYIQRTCEYLYFLADYWQKEELDDVNSTVRIYVRSDEAPSRVTGGGADIAYFRVSIHGGQASVYLSSRGEAQAGLSSTPGDPTLHRTFEYAISIAGLGARLDSPMGIYFSLADSTWEEYEYGEWYNRSVYYDTDEDDWAVGYLKSGSVPWLDTSPVSGTVLPDAVRAVTITFDATEVQPTTHTVSLVLTALDGHIVAHPYIPLTLTVVPSPTMGWLTGKITDRRTGERLVATVSSPGMGATTSNSEGEYLIWLDSGLRTLTVSADGYLSTTATVSVSPGTAAVPHNFTLRRDSPQIFIPPVSPLTATWGNAITYTLSVSNGGPRPLTFQLYETTMGDDLPVVVAESVPSTALWPRRVQKNVPLRRIVTAAEPENTPNLSPFLFDALGDGETSDLVLGEAAVGGWGWDGSPPVLTLRLTFADTTSPRDVVGYLYLDTDCNPATGRAPQEAVGSPEHDIGYDYYLDLFTGASLGLVDVWRQDGVYIGSAPLAYDAHSLTIALSLSLLGYDDGVMDVALALGTAAGVKEWAPEVAHATIGLGADWVTESPLSAEVPAGAERPVTLTLDTTLVQPGVHHLRLVAVGDDPVTAQVYLPLTVTVLPAPTMGGLTGFVTDAFRNGVEAQVAAQGFPAAISEAGTGRYTLWLEEGEWAVRAALPFSGRLISRTVTVHISAQETLTQDFTLSWCALRLPVVMRWGE